MSLSARILALLYRPHPAGARGPAGSPPTTCARPPSSRDARVELEDVGSLVRVTVERIGPREAQAELVTTPGAAVGRQEGARNRRVRRARRAGGRVVAGRAGPKRRGAGRGARAPHGAALGRGVRSRLGRCSCAPSTSAAAPGGIAVVVRDMGYLDRRIAQLDRLYVADRRRAPCSSPCRSRWATASPSSSRCPRWAAACTPSRGGQPGPAGGRGRCARAARSGARLQRDGDVPGAGPWRDVRGRASPRGGRAASAPGAGPRGRRSARRIARARNWLTAEHHRRPRQAGVGPARVPRGDPSDIGHHPEAERADRGRRAPAPPRGARQALAGRARGAVRRRRGRRRRGAVSRAGVRLSAGSRLERAVGAAGARVPLGHDALFQVLFNLCLNAIQAQPSGGQLSVRTSCTTSGLTAWIPRRPGPPC